MKSSCIALLSGPNLNLLGERNREIYGGASLSSIERDISKAAMAAGYRLWSHQTNNEGGLVTAVHAARWTADAILINPGGYTHTSIALRDALELFPGPIAEIHLSDIFAREPFRHHSYVKDVATISIVGKGPKGYLEGLKFVLGRLRSNS